MVTTTHRAIPALLAVAIALGMPLAASAGTINHQGVVTVNGVRFTGTGQFKFAIRDPDTGTNVWSNDGTGGSGQPSAAVSLTVTDGLYTVQFGDTGAGMVAISPTIFTDDNLVLRVWFNDGTHGFQQLSPDHKLASSAYAFQASDVADNSITTAKIADGAVTSVKLAPDATGAWDVTGSDVHYTAGKVGIGTSTPATTLDIYAATGDILTAAGPTAAPDYNNWQQTTAAAAWTGRNNHRSVVHNGKIWVMGGFHSGSRHNDVWSSTDGVSWTQATASAGWVGRNVFGAAVFDNKIWVMGGWDGGSLRRDVWYSSDGASWTQATASAPWLPRYGCCCVAHDGKLWMYGGNGGAVGTDFYNDVWYTTNGSSWTQATAAASWPARRQAACTVFDGKMWVMGGYNNGGDLNDAWYSADGVTWTVATSSAGWVARNGHVGIAYDSKLWILGGAGGGYRNDVWYSADGASWTQATASAAWSARTGHDVVVFNGSAWLTGGDSFSTNLNDVWDLAAAARPAVMKLTDTGTLGIGTDTPDENYVVDANGGIKCQSVTQISTRDAKQGITPLSEQEIAAILRKLETTPLYRFSYKTGHDAGVPRMGLIAEDSPRELLSPDGKGIDMNQTLTCLLAALKAQQQQNAAQEEQISRLQEQVAKLQQQQKR